MSTNSNEDGPAVLRPFLEYEIMKNTKKTNIKNNKINKDTVPENFTVSLALIDAIPVLFFGASMMVISFMFDSLLFSDRCCGLYGVGSD